MIVESMTYEQVVEQIWRAEERANKWIEHNENKLWRYFRDPKKKCHVQYLPVGAKVPNMVIVTEHPSRNMLVPSWFVWRESDHGKYFYSLANDADGRAPIMITPHWVARYIERLGLNCTPMEAMIHHFSIGYGEQVVERETHNAPTQKLEDRVVGSIIYSKGAEGITIVDKVDGLRIYKTFLTDDMGLRQDKELIHELVDWHDHFDVVTPLLIASHECGRADSNLSPEMIEALHSRHNTPDYFETHKSPDKPKPKKK